MIKNCLKNCCQNCLYLDIETENLRRYIDRKPEIRTKIFCKHEPVCKAYYEETEATIHENTSSNE